MSFESRILSFAERFLSERSFQLIVAPALADLQFDRGPAPLDRAANRLAVLKALAGGLRDDLVHNSGNFVALALVPTCYYVFLLALCSDFFSTSAFVFSNLSGFFAVAALILVLSLGPVMVCFWPDRQPARPVD